MVLAARSVHIERPPLYIAVPVGLNERIFDGALVAIAAFGSNDSLAINWTDTVTGQSHFFMGIARVTAETGVTPAAGESVIGNTASSIEVSIDISGLFLRNVEIGNVVGTDVGELVYATDENTFDGAATPGANPVGWIARLTTIATPSIGDVKLFTPGEFRAHRQI